MALIRGFRGLFPCPICLVPAGEQMEITTKYPLRSQEDTKDTILKAASPSLSKTETENILKNKGLRPVDVSLLLIINNAYADKL